MITPKMKQLVAGGSVIRAMFEEGRIMAEKFGAENVYDFSLGNPNTPPPAAVKEAIFDILENEPEMMVHGYMSNVGYEDVRKAMADNINRKQGTSYTARNIIMTVGAAGALNVVMKTIIEPGDEVLLQAPFFGEYLNYISNFDGKAVIVSPEYTNFSINFPELEQKITPKTKAMILNTPNNPTGAIYSEQDIIRLCDILRAKQKEYGHAIYLISDEPYREIVFGGQTVPYLPCYYENAFVGYSYSKTLSLPGERIGYIVAPDTLEDFEGTVAALSVANRILGFVNAPSLMQRVVARLGDISSDMTIYQENKKELYEALTSYGYEMVEPQGAFYMFPKAPGGDDKAFCEAAKEERILVVPGSTFAGPGYFRLAFCVSRQTVQNALPGFKRLAEKYHLKD